MISYVYNHYANQKMLHDRFLMMVCGHITIHGLIGGIVYFFPVRCAIHNPSTLSNLSPVAPHWWRAVH